MSLLILIHVSVCCFLMWRHASEGYFLCRIRRYDLAAVEFVTAAALAASVALVLAFMLGLLNGGAE